MQFLLEKNEGKMKEEKIIKESEQLCLYCMEKHKVKTVEISEQMKYKGKMIDYIGTYEYCENADVYWENGSLMDMNLGRIREKLRKKKDD